MNNNICKNQYNFMILWKINNLGSHWCSFYLSVFLAKNNCLSSILSTDKKVNDSFSIESKKKEPTDRHVSNARFLVSISWTEQSKIKGKRKNKQTCTDGVPNFRQRDMKIRCMLV